MRILFADKFPDARLTTLRDAGWECDVKATLTADELPGLIGDYDVLVVRSTEVTAATLEAADRLKLVIRAGAGVNTIDLDAASARAIYVSNVPGKNSTAVAELAMGLLLAIDRNIPDNVADLRVGRWDKSRYQKARGLKGRSLGIIGAGAIGLSLASRAHAFGMEIHAVGRSDRSEEATARLAELGTRYHPDIYALASACDVLSVHVPASRTTKGLIGPRFLARCRPGTIIINTSRGEAVDEEALLEALDRGVRAGLDVYADEPGSGAGEFHSRIAKHPNVYGTHHIGASTEQAQEATADEVVRILEDFRTGAPRNEVNLETHLRGSSTLVVRHLNRVGVLAGVLVVLGEAGINVEQMENRIFASGHAAAATLHMSGVLEAQTLDELTRVNGVIGISVEEREDT